MKRPTFASIALVLVALASFAAPSRAAIRVDRAGGRDLRAVKLAESGDGRLVAAWTDARNDQLVLQRLDGRLGRRGAEVRLPVAGPAIDSGRVRLTGTSGGFVVASADPECGWRVRRLDGELRIASDLRLAAPFCIDEVVPGPDGGFLAVEVYAPVGAELRAGLFAADGSARGEPFAIGARISEQRYTTRSVRRAVATPDGGFLVLWSEADPGYRTIVDAYATRVSPDGVVAIEREPILELVSGSFVPDLAAGAAGELIAMDVEMAIVRFDSWIAAYRRWPGAGWLRVVPEPAHGWDDRFVAAAGALRDDGGFAVASAEVGGRVRLHRYGADARRLAPPLRLSTRGSAPAVLARGGSYVVAWLEPVGRRTGVFARVVAPRR